jgi:ABC-type nitrate/sulfonate/bicarbonate transport system substrate-binding protein
MIAMIDRGVPMKVLTGLHVGCFELFVHGDFDGVTDLKGKSVGIPFLGSPPHLFLSVIAANVGIDPAKDIRWISSGKIPAKQLFIDSKVDAFLGFPPDPQELHARRIGHAALNSATDQPWSQYFCCMMAGSPSYVQNYPVATKRVVRAMLKTIDLCVSAPALVERALVDGGFTNARPEYVLRALRDTPYDRWRDYDAEDTLRFYALRLRDLGFIKAIPQKGRSVGVQALGSNPHALLTLMAAQVGLDPVRDIHWITDPSVKPIERFVEGKIDAFLGFPPEPQDLRARHIGHVIVNTAVDRPWSQYFCCLLGGNAEYVRTHPVATKRVLRAVLKAADLCATEPDRAARRLVDSGFAPRYDYAFQTLSELPYDKWREYDAEDTMRFYALRLREAGFIKSGPQKIIADGTDWRFLNELKRELKA